MTNMTDEQIEDTFIQVREKFEARSNETGLEMLDSVEERWEAMGELSDRQLAWLDRQLNETWKRKKSKTQTTPEKTESPTRAPQPDSQILISAGQRWSPSFGQFGGLIKLFPCVVHAASLLFAVAGASPGNGVGSIV